MRSYFHVRIKFSLGKRNISTMKTRFWFWAAWIPFCCHWFYWEHFSLMDRITIHFLKNCHYFLEVLQFCQSPVCSDQHHVFYVLTNTVWLRSSQQPGWWLVSWIKWFEVFKPSVRETMNTYGQLCTDCTFNRLSQTMVFIYTTIYTSHWSWNSWDPVTSQHTSIDLIR